MKKILLAAVLACACLQTANAQEANRNRNDFAEKMVQRMDRALDLNDKQEKDLLALYNDVFSQRKTDKTGDKQTRLNARKDFNEKVNAILTEDQQKKWAEIKLQQADKRKEAYKRNKESKANKTDFAEKMVDRMDDALDLSDQQEKDLIALYTNVFNGNKATDKQGRLNARKDFNKKVNAILTEDQQKKWAEIKAQQVEKRKNAAKRNVQK